jgi:hypothetical protein
MWRSNPATNRFLSSPLSAVFWLLTRTSSSWPATPPTSACHHQPSLHSSAYSFLPVARFVGWRRRICTFHSRSFVLLTSWFEPHNNPLLPHDTARFFAPSPFRDLRFANSPRGHLSTPLHTEMRTSQLLAAVLAVSTVSASWDSFFDNVQGLGKVENVLYGRQASMTRLKSSVGGAVLTGMTRIGLV